MCVAGWPWPGRVVLPITGPPLSLLQSLLQGGRTSGQSCVQLLVAARFLLWLHHTPAFPDYRELLTSWVGGLNSLLAKGETASLFAVSVFCQGFAQRHAQSTFYGCPGGWPWRNGSKRTHSSSFLPRMPFEAMGVNA